MENDQTQTTDIYFTPYNVDIHEISAFSLKSFVGRVSELPSSLRSILSTESTSEFIEDTLGASFNLEIEQKKNVARIIRDMILGDLFIGDAVTEIQNRLGIDPNTAKSIANQIVNQLFAPALEDIKKIQMEKFGDRIKKNPVSPQPSPPRPIPGADLPETGGNIVDLRNK